MRLTSALILGLLLALCVPSAASAAVRTASPNGTGNCTTSPCSLATAITGALNSDEIVVTPGNYGSATAPITSTINTFALALNVHGVAGRPRPKVFLSNSFGIGVYGGGSTVRHLAVEQRRTASDSFVIDGNNLTIEDVIGRNLGKWGARANATSTVRNSVFTEHGTGGAAVLTQNVGGTITIRNVTAIAYGPGSGAFDVFAQSTDVTANVTNALFESAAQDILLQSDGGHSATLNIDHSNFRGVQPSGMGTNTNNGGVGNQTPFPMFVDFPNEDFHQAANSAFSINKGADSAANGATDFDGQARKIGVHTDIGADEIGPPGVATGAATKRKQASATLNGVVNPNGLATTYRFQFGKTKSYGGLTPVKSAGASPFPLFVSGAPTGLTPGSTYHYRLLAGSQGGTAFGVDRVFTTTALLKGGAVTAKSVTVRNGAARIRTRCPGKAVKRCVGTLSLVSAKKLGASKKRIKVGKAKFSIRKGKAKKVKVKLTKKAKNFFKHRKSLKARWTLVWHDAAANKGRKTTGKLTLKLP